MYGELRFGVQWHRFNLGENERSIHQTTERQLEVSTVYDVQFTFPIRSNFDPQGTTKLFVFTSTRSLSKEKLALENIEDKIVELSSTTPTL